LHHQTIRADQPCKAKDAVEALRKLTCPYLKPAFINTDNSPECIVTALKYWLSSTETTSAYIKRGSLLQNSFTDSINDRFRKAWPNIEPIYFGIREQATRRATRP
jgi:hypothetical protein